MLPRQITVATKVYRSSLLNNKNVIILVVTVTGWGSIPRHAQSSLQQQHFQDSEDLMELRLGALKSISRNLDQPNFGPLSAPREIVLVRTLWFFRWNDGVELMYSMVIWGPSFWIIIEICKIWGNNLIHQSKVSFPYSQTHIQWGRRFGCEIVCPE